MKSIIGIDEVGRGPIAGPVSVCAFKINDPKFKLLVKNIKIPCRDSKKLTRLQREAWFAQIKIWQKENKCHFCVSSVSVREIDKIGISKAIQKALDNSLNSLFLKSSDSKKLSKILLDGGLKAPKEFKNQKTIIKGDEKKMVIAFASIVAKVTRDSYMRKEAKKFPHYYFDEHVGYGTKKHYAAIKKYGLTSIHRKSFLRNTKLKTL